MKFLEQYFDIYLFLLILIISNSNISISLKLLSSYLHSSNATGNVNSKKSNNHLIKYSFFY